MADEEFTPGSEGTGGVSAGDPIAGDPAAGNAPEGADGQIGAEGQTGADGGAAAAEGHAAHKGFSSKIGFVLAAAGSAVGLGNLWRFPYLAAKYGGGIFLLCYIALAVTFGFCLLVLEIAIGRKTGKGTIGAFAALSKKFKWFGFLVIAVPIIIVPYYCVIGGWVVRYIFAYITGDGMLIGDGVTETTSTQFFSVFTSSPWQPIVFFLIFLAATIAVVVGGVRKGIERMSKILMPLLAIIAVFLMIYVLCQDGAGAGVADLFIPDFSEFTFGTLLAALGQLFYSMSLAMGIMITYGSYMKKSAKISGAARQISVCDTLFAIVAATIIIPSIYAYSPDPEAAIAASGPSLMFVQLPLVFNALPGGRVIGALFFILVLFAAITSSVSLVETIVAVLRENLHLKRWVACLIVFGVSVLLGSLSSLGFGPLSFIHIGEGSSAKSILDMFDWLSNSVLMPIVAIGTCLIAGFFTDSKAITDEIDIKSKGMRTYFLIMIRFIAPVCMAAILFSGIFMQL